MDQRRNSSLQKNKWRKGYTSVGIEDMLGSAGPAEGLPIWIRENNPCQIVPFSFLVPSFCHPVPQNSLQLGEKGASMCPEYREKSLCRRSRNGTAFETARSSIPLRYGSEMQIHPEAQDKGSLWTRKYIPNWATIPSSPFSHPMHLGYLLLGMSTSFSRKSPAWQNRSNRQDSSAWHNRSTWVHQTSGGQSFKSCFGEEPVAQRSPKNIPGEWTEIVDQEVHPLFTVPLSRRA